MKWTDLDQEKIAWLRTHRIPLAIGVGALILFILAYSIFYRSTEDVSVTQRVLVEVERAKTGSVGRHVTLNGTLVASKSLDLYAEIEGKISKTLVEQGQHVAKDTPIFQLEDGIYKAQMSEAKAALNLREGELKRARHLFDKGFSAQAAVDKKRAEYEQSKAALQRAQYHLDQTVIRAPFDCVVGLIHVSDGEFVSRNKPLVHLASKDVCVDFPVPESYLKDLLVGEEIDVIVEGTGSLPLEGRIMAFDSRADPHTHSIQVRAQLVDSKAWFKPGQFARVSLEVGEQDDAVLIPIQSVEKDGDRTFVFVVVDGAAIQVEVTLGQREKGKVQVKDGLKTGDLVVTSGQMKLHDGRLVRFELQEDQKGMDVQGLLEAKKENS